MNIQAFPLILAILLIGFPQIGETIYTPSLPDIAKSFQTSEFMVELTLGTFFVGFAFGVLCWGVMADKKGRRPAMLSGLGLYILGSLGCCLSPSIEWLLAFRFLQAFGASAGSVITQTMLRDVFTGAERGRIFAIVGAALSFSPALGPLIGGYLDQYWGWQANFFVLFLVGIVLGILSFIQLPETQGQQSARSTWMVAKKLFCDSRILCFAFLIGACNGILFSYYAEAPFIFIELFGLTPLQYGWMGVLVALSMCLASWISHQIQAWGVDRILFIGGFTILLGTCGLTAVASMNVHLLNYGLEFMIAPLFLLFTGIGILIPNCLSVALIHYKDVLGTAGSLFGFLYYVLIAGITSLMGFFHNGTAVPLGVYTLILTCGMLGCLKILHGQGKRVPQTDN